MIEIINRFVAGLLILLSLGSAMVAIDLFSRSIWADGVGVLIGSFVFFVFFRSVYARMEQSS